MVSQWQWRCFLHWVSTLHHSLHLQSSAPVLKMLEIQLLKRCRVSDGSVLHQQAHRRLWASPFWEVRLSCIEVLFLFLSSFPFAIWPWPALPPSTYQNWRKVCEHSPITENQPNTRNILANVLSIRSNLSPKIYEKASETYLKWHTSPKTIINHQQKHILTFSDSTSEGKAFQEPQSNWGFNGV